MDDDEMEIEDEAISYVVEEVDFIYEFDAARFFDFTRPETLEEESNAVKWFQTAPCYPPSQNAEGSIKSTNVENKAALLRDHCDDNELINEASLRGVNNNRDCGAVNKGNSGNFESEILLELRFKSQVSALNSMKKPKSFAKPIPRSSTLMKPTASLLAKQNWPTQVATSRFPTLLAQSVKGFCNHPALESQAAKRQKLEGGNLRKINDSKQHVDLLCKVPTKDQNSLHGRLKLTIPREPDLETAYRAQRIRPNISSAPSEHVIPAARRFKARPVNKKILEAPSLPFPKKSTPKLPEFQEFHLKTSERAMQHSSTVSSSLSGPCGDYDKGLGIPNTIPVLDSENRERRRPNAMSASQLDGYGQMRNFKPLPLNRKIFSSKGDIGVFRTNKRETTVPMEFNSHTEKMQHNLTIELFNKLSLASELQPNNGSQMKLPYTSCMYTEGSKENRLNSFQPGDKHIRPEQLDAYRIPNWKELIEYSITIFFGAAYVRPLETKDMPSFTSLKKLLSKEVYKVDFSSS